MSPVEELVGKIVIVVLRKGYWMTVLYGGWLKLGRHKSELCNKFKKVNVITTLKNFIRNFRFSFHNEYYIFNKKI